MDVHIEDLDLATVIETKCLRLRPLERSDLAWICEVAGNYEVSKWLVPVPHPYSMQDAMDFYEWERAGDLDALWITDADVPVGSISIGTSLGYWIDPKAAGQGYATDAAQAVVSEFFENTDAQQVNSCYFEGNIGSKRVLEKVGFIDVGGEDRFSKAQNKHVSGRNMELTRDRWQSLRRLEQ